VQRVVQKHSEQRSGTGSGTIEPSFRS